MKQRKQTKKSILDYPLTWGIGGAFSLGLSIDTSSPFFKGMFLVMGVMLLIQANNVDFK